MSQHEADPTPSSAPPGRPAAESARPGQDAATPTVSVRGRDGLAGPLLVYTALRVGLIAVVTALLMLFMPFIVALLFAIIVQLPLSWLLFAGPRRRVNEAMAASSAHRRAERERLRAALAGEDPRAAESEGRT
ncbi:MAG TPA: DUF4229 domain-containing protein [Nakamurella sp.]